MYENVRLKLPACAAAAMCLSIGAALTMAPLDDLTAAGPPAGQMCSRGSFVIGFDEEGNIVCSEACGNGVLDAGETCDDGNTEAGDGCSPACRSEAAAAAVIDPTPAEAPPESPPEAAPKAAAAVPVLAITDVDPSSVVFGTRETEVTVIGAGFTSESRVLFEGSSYEPSVDPSGARLTVTLPTRELPIGRYAVTVVNASGERQTFKRAFVVY